MEYIPLILPLAIILGFTIYCIIDRICEYLEKKSKNKEK